MANIANIDQLVSAGLAPKNQLQYARIVLSDPKQGIESMVYRGLAISIMKKMTDAMLNDAIIYNRMRQILLSKNEGHLPGIGTPEAVDFAAAHTPGLLKKTKVIKKIAKEKSNA